MQTNMGTLAVADRQVYCAYGYDATNKDELTFDIDDRLTVVDRERGGERGWWYARREGGNEGALYGFMGCGIIL